MSENKKVRVRITDSTPQPSFPTVKQIRRLVKDEKQLYKDWPHDAILKWTDQHSLMCEQCGLFYSNWSNLKRHYQTHEDTEKACLKCPDCLKTYSRSDHLVRHIKEYCKIANPQTPQAKPISTGAILATNEVLNQATTSNKRKTFQWALKPLDLDIEISKPKRRRTVRRKQTVKIPLQSKCSLPDPRIPTPITDEDALLLEKMLEEQPSSSEEQPSSSEEQPSSSQKQPGSPQEQPSSSQEQSSSSEDKHEDEGKENDSAKLTGEILFSNLDDPDWAVEFSNQHPVNEDDQQWIEDLLRPTTPNKPEDPWANPQSAMDSNRKIQLTTGTPSQPNTDRPGTSKNINPTVVENIDKRHASSPILQLNINMSAGIRGRSPSYNPYDPALPEFLVQEAEVYGRIPPWELYSSMEQVMGTIWHDGEKYLVLDEYEDLKDLEDLNEPLEEDYELDDPTEDQ